MHKIDLAPSYIQKLKVRYGGMNFWILERTCQFREVKNNTIKMVQGPKY